MNLLIDTNVILDLLLKRPPFYEQAAAVLKLASKDNIQIFVSASAITDIYYIANRTIKDKQTVKNLLKRLLEIVNIATVSSKEIEMALELEWNDFEDSVQYAVAYISDMDILITRNIDDYKQSDILINTPGQILSNCEKNCPM